MKLPIYLDYSATCPVDPRVAEKMMQCLTMDGLFGNPASRSHRFGWQAEEAVDLARNQVAELIGADPREIVFTSGATESNNLAIKGIAHFYAGKGKHIITSKTEHKAVLDTCRQREREGYVPGPGVHLGQGADHGFGNGVRHEQAMFDVAERRVQRELACRRWVQAEHQVQHVQKSLCIRDAGQGPAQALPVGAGGESPQGLSDRLPHDQAAAGHHRVQFTDEARWPPGGGTRRRNALFVCLAVGILLRRFGDRLLMATLQA